MPQWIDYKQLKSEIAFSDVLEHYNVKTKTKGEQAKGCCPLPTHKSDDKSRTFSANLDRNIFQCFGCGAKGNVLDFIALMENLNPQDPKAFHKVGVFAKRKFLYTPQREVSSSSKKSKPNQDGKKRVIVNPPLDFELQGLDPDHPWFEEHRFKPETVQHFGAGYCKRGLMKGRIAFPLHDDEGQLIGYAGRLVDDSKINEDNPKYLFPGTRERNGIVYEFDTNQFLYNGHRMAKPVDQLIVVEGFTSMWWLWQNGFNNVVALMGTSCSLEQSKLIVKTVQSDGRIWIMPDGDEAGKHCAENVLIQIAPHRFARWIRNDDGCQPTDLIARKLQELLIIE